MLSTKIATGSSGPSKTISPGKVTAKINSVVLEETKFKPGSYFLILNLETEDLGPEFEGFMINKDNPELGRHKGQVGKVKTSDWAYSDGETKTGTIISRDTEILRAIKNLCTSMDIMDWYDAQDEKHETIEDLVTAFNTEAPFKDRWMEYCIAGREYLNKQGYTNFDLYLPKFVKGFAPYATLDNEEKLIQFDPIVHVKKIEVKQVESFGDDIETDSPKAKTISKDFEL
jgi:hypothetical protein